jgi:hypothetical protein
MSRKSWTAALAAVAVLVLPTGALAQASTRQPSPTAPAPGHTTSFTDAQLRSFASASAEIDPISRALPSASAEQRTAPAAQIRTILQRNNIDSATYNAIAAQAQRDPALVARINGLRTSAPPQPTPAPAPEKQY